MSAARGENATLFFGPEKRFGVPDVETFEALDFVPPLGLGGGGKLDADPSLSRTGFMKASVQGDEGGGPLDLEISLDPASALPFLVHLLGDVTKSTPEAGVNRYVINPQKIPKKLESLFFGLFLDPVERRWIYGGLLSDLSLGLKKGLIGAKMKGVSQHQSRTAFAQEGVKTGTYAHLPALRGPLADAEAGELTVEVVSVAPLTIRAAQGRAPDAGDPALAVLYGLDGHARWTPLRDSAADLGIIGREVKKPLEVYLPGKVATHALLAVGDSWTWDPAIDDVVAPGVAGDGRLSLFHLRAFVRDVGATAWIEFDLEDGQLDLKRAIVTVRGSSSPYPLSIEPDGAVSVDLKITRGYEDTFFIDRFERLTPVEFRLLLESDLITAGERVALDIVLPYAQIEEEPKRAIKKGRMVEEVSLSGKETPAGGVPLTITITSRRDWTAPSYLAA